MNKFILVVIGLIVVGAIVLSNVEKIDIKKSIPNSGSSATYISDVGYIQRKDITFTIKGKEYDGGDPEEKFLLAGKDKDLSTKFYVPSMGKIGTIEQDGQTREVYRCHVECPGSIFGGVFGVGSLCHKGQDLAYIYILKSSERPLDQSYTGALNRANMDVYLAEKYWQDPPVPAYMHDTVSSVTTIDNKPDLIPVTNLKIDLTATLQGQEKNYTLLKSGTGSPTTQHFSKDFIKGFFDTAAVLQNKTVPDIGSVSLYALKGDTDNNELYGLDNTIILPDDKDHNFYIFNKIVGPNSQSDNVTRYSLQLGKFTFVKSAVISSSGYGWWTPDCKPAIYLYPQTVLPVSVAVNPKGFLTTTIPVYPKDGWQVIAYPNGTVNTQGAVYPYLYYEAKIEDSAFEKPKDGYVVSSDELPSLFKTLLPKLGLNSSEQQVFSDYWTKTLPKSPYYFVGILNQNQTNIIEPLTISPKPDTIIRVRLYFEALNFKVSVASPKHTGTPERKGFTVVEWGGMVKLHKDQPFTCSQ